MSYLVSVVVPTKNRYKYLKELIKLIDSFKLEELELVIHDNSDDNSEILSYLKDVSNENIKYYYTTEHLTMSTNADAAIRKAQGEYICYIGDDDGVCRNIIDCVKWMKMHDIDAVRTGTVTYYYNEDLETLSHLSIKKSNFKVRRVDPIVRVNQLIRRGMILSDTKIPMVYQAIVKKTVLDQIYNIGGTHFPGVVPDISGGVCLCFVLNRYFEIDIPVVINGLSSNAGGGVFKINRDGVLPLEEVTFITKESRDKWNSRLPRLWYGSSVWTDAGIKALEYMNRTDLINNVNFEYSYARAIRFYPWLIKKVAKFSNKKVKLCFMILRQIVSRYTKALLNRLPIGKKFIVARGLSGIINCEQFISSNLKKDSFQSIIQ